MVSHYISEKQQKLLQFIILNVKQNTEAPSNIHHSNVRARAYVRGKVNCIEPFKCESDAKKEGKICFQDNVEGRHVDRTVWNHNTRPLPVTLDPLECKNLLRHLNDTHNKILNKFIHNKTLTLLEDHFYQEQLEQLQTPFILYKFNKLHTSTFVFMPAAKKLDI